MQASRLVSFVRSHSHAVVALAMLAIYSACGGGGSPSGPSGGGGGGGGGGTGGGNNGGGFAGPSDNVLVGSGDIALCGSPGAMATANQLENITGMVFAAGDTAYMSGTPQEFRDCYDPTWGRPWIKSRTWPVPGNHEYQTPGASGYYDYFGDAAGPAGKGYYRRQLGKWTFLGLNSEIDVGPNSEQYRWLQSELATVTTPCTVAVWHKPLFTSGPNGDNRNMLDIWKLLYQFNADVILNGHDHLYERFGRQNPDGVSDSVKGIQQFTVGTAGAVPYGFNTPKATSQVRLNDMYGVLKLTLNDNSYSWQFLPVDGRPGDSGSNNCH